MSGRVSSSRDVVVGLFVLSALSFGGERAHADWAITPRGSTSLSIGAVTGIREFSGVAYVGQAPGPSSEGLHRFAAVQDSGDQIVYFDVGISTNGTLTSANAVSQVSLAPSADYEGLTLTNRNSVLVSEEGAPGVHEHQLSTGARLQTFPLPTIYTSDRANKSLESLTRSLDGRTVWTANEEALTPDGPIASSSVGTTVRLQKFIDDNGAIAAGPQFAYVVDSIHSTTGPNRSGLVDLVMLPDDTLLALERSAALTLPAFRSRMYEVVFAGATDTSVAAFVTGLSGKSFTPAAKTLLWSGQVGGVAGANLEGLGLGPALPNGNWLLLGVVDNGGDGATTIASFELSLTGEADPGDYNRDDEVDVSDYVLWKNTYGSTLALAADGNGNKIVDAADYTVWRNHIGAQAEGTAVVLQNRAASIPEPATIVAAIIAAQLVYFVRHRLASNKSRIEGNSRGRRL